ncbi:MAG: DegT/DnrJ/EryC1/StrS family aminotransferase [Planctomycetota bacterium]
MRNSVWNIRYKVIACGDGGLFSTRKRAHYEKALIFHDAGIGFRPHAKDLSVPIFAGMNLRGNEILAAMMRVQLGRLDGIVRDLHRVHRAISTRVAGVSGLEPIPYNGSRDAGTRTGTGATLGFRFPTEAAARAFAAGFAAAQKPRLASASLPIDSGRHVYSNWECVMQKRVLHAEAMNAFRMLKNRASRARFTKNMLPRTLAILKTTVLISVNPGWTGKQIDAVSAAIVKAAR